MDNPNPQGHPGEEHFYNTDKTRPPVRQLGKPLLIGFLSAIGVLLAILIIMAGFLIHQASASPPTQTSTSQATPRPFMSISKKSTKSKRVATRRACSDLLLIRIRHPLLVMSPPLHTRMLTFGRCKDRAAL